MIRKSNENITKHTPHLQISAPVLEPVAWLFPGVARCFRDLFSEHLGCSPWTYFGIPWGTLGPIVSTVQKSVVANILQNSKIPGQQIEPITPSNKNKQPEKQT